MWLLIKSLVSFFLLYTPPNLQAVKYAGNVSRPLGSKLHPLRVLFYLILLQYALRTTLYSAYYRRYTRYDPLMAVADCITTHHMVGVCAVPYAVFLFLLDFLLVLRPNQKVATMLMDILVYSRG